jgi:hypothetical protein
MEDLVPYVILLGLLLFARGCDFLSTWVATPNLVLEANPVAKFLGWRWGLVLNSLICVAFAFWPLPAIVITTTSLLVAARNFQGAWLMRSMGESNYRFFMADRLSEGSRVVFLCCLFAQTALYASIGGSLMYFSQFGDTLLLVPFGIGMGMITYAFAVLVYSLLSVSRLRVKIS